MDIQGTRVVITGASRGLGAALAVALASRGARLALVARSEGALRGLAEQIRAGGGEAHVLAGDVADKQAVFPLIGQANALLGGVDVLIHNAGTLGTPTLAPLLDTGCEQLQSALEVNVLGPFRWSKAVVGSMALRGQGLVVHVTTDAAVTAYPGWGAYGVSKAALDHLARSWAVELEGSGVRILSVDPGELDTRMHADALPEADRSTLTRPEDAAEQLAAVIARAEVWPSGSRLELSALRLAARANVAVTP